MKSIEKYFANERRGTPDKSWVQLAPFGDFDNSAGMQRFTPEDAKNIVNEFNSLAGLPQRALGLPFYIGHPDHPLFKDRYTDTKAYGRVKTLAVREDKTCDACNEFIARKPGSKPCTCHGLFGESRWNDDGKKLIANESFHGHSVNWRLRRTGAVWHPISLKSVGFTNEPNMPVAPVTTFMANEAPEDDADGCISFANSAWDEDQHPRDGHGKFSAAEASAAAEKASEEAKQSPAKHRQAEDAHLTAAYLHDVDRTEKLQAGDMLGAEDAKSQRDHHEAEAERHAMENRVAIRKNVAKQQLERVNAELGDISKQLTSGGLHPEYEKALKTTQRELKKRASRHEKDMANEISGDEQAANEESKNMKLTDYIKKMLGRKPEDAMSEDEMCNELDKFAGSCKCATDKQAANEIALKTIRENLVKAGIKIPEATEDVVAFMANELVVVTNKVGDVTGKLATAETNFANEKKERERLSGEVGTIKTAKDAAEANFVNERKARTTELLTLGIRAGKINANDKKQLEAEFANETSFAGALEKFSKTDRKIKVASEVDEESGKRQADSRNRQTQVLDMVNEEMTKSKCTYDQAWAKVKAAKPELFEKQSVA